MTTKLVILTKVDSRMEADMIVAKLRAYGVFAHAPEYNGRMDPIPINVVDTDLELARELLRPTE